MNERNISNRFGLIFFALLIVFVQGCSTVSKKDRAEVDSVDPHEDINRVAYNLTDRVDRVIFVPVVDAYIDYVPDEAQQSIGNFYDNLAYPNVVLNSFLQGKVKQGFADSLRFAINSTVGLFGLFDMATDMGLEEHNEDFGQTLGVWGVDSGSYLFLPLIGPSSERDVAGVPVSMFTNVLFYAGTFVGAGVFAPLTILGAIDKRARLVGPMRVRDQAALDPYLFVREASLQQREYLVYDGNPPLDLYDEESFQDNPFDTQLTEQHSENGSLGSNELEGSDRFQAKDDSFN